ncbi:hypothetical protein B0T16DRAFT_416975, partial [Cercophora newfieldiana]
MGCQGKVVVCLFGLDLGFGYFVSGIRVEFGSWLPCLWYLAAGACACVYELDVCGGDMTKSGVRSTGRRASAALGVHTHPIRYCL